MKSRCRRRSRSALPTFLVSVLVAVCASSNPAVAARATSASAPTLIATLRSAPPRIAPAQPTRLAAVEKPKAPKKVRTAKAKKSRQPVRVAAIESAAPEVAVAVAPAAAAAAAPAPHTDLLDFAPMAKPTVVERAPIDGDTERRFDVVAEDTPARAFFFGLAAGSPTNLVLHPDMRGRITATLSNVTIVQALEAIRDAYGFDFRRTSSGFLVLPATVQTRVFQVSYLNVQRAGSSLTRISSGQVSQAPQEAAGTEAVKIAGASSGDEGDSTDQSVEVTGTSIATHSEADFWVSLEKSLKMLVASEKSASIVVNPMAGLVVVRASPDRLREVGDYLHSVEEVVTRQVVIEAKIVEVALDDAYQSGINWATVFTRPNGNVIGIGQSAPPGSFQTSPLDRVGGNVDVRPGVDNSGVSTTRQLGAFALSLDFGDFNAFIELLEQQGKTRVLSSPRVATLNNQKAVIKAGTDEFFVTDVSSETTSGTATSTSRDVQLTPFFSGIALDVTPQISEGGAVTLHIHPTASDVRDQTKTLTVSGTTDTLPLAVSEIRESDSVVKAQSGQVIVIGGLMRSTQQDQRFGTPGLSKVPLLGKLFRSKQNVTRKSELVILLRPTVVSDDADWQAQRDASRATLSSLDSGGSSP